MSKRSGFELQYNDAKWTPAALYWGRIIKHTWQRMTRVVVAAWHWLMKPAPRRPIPFNAAYCGGVVPVANNFCAFSDSEEALKQFCQDMGITAPIKKNAVVKQTL